MNKISLLVFSVVILFSACEKTEPPVISDVEIGTGNSKSAYIGGDFHIEATIVADAKIASIRLVIHPEEEGEQQTSGSLVDTDGAEHHEEWEVDSTYTGAYANVRNTTFHEHLPVPTYAAAGEYHLHLYVTDVEGNQSVVEEEINILTPSAKVK